MTELAAEWFLLVAWGLFCFRFLLIIVDRPASQSWCHPAAAAFSKWPKGEIQPRTTQHRKWLLHNSLPVENFMLLQAHCKFGHGPVSDVKAAQLKNLWELWHLLVTDRHWLCHLCLGYATLDVWITSFTSSGIYEEVKSLVGISSWPALKCKIGVNRRESALWPCDPVVQFFLIILGCGPLCSAKEKGAGLSKMTLKSSCCRAKTVAGRQLYSLTLSDFFYILILISDFTFDPYLEVTVFCLCITYQKMLPHTKVKGSNFHLI